MTQDSRVEQKELGSLSQDEGIKPQKWCVFCIAAARGRGEKGFVVLLTTVDKCEALDHGSNTTCAAIRADKHRKRLEAHDSDGHFSGDMINRKTDCRQRGEL